MAKFAINASGAMLLPSLVQVSESISGSVVPLAMFCPWLADILPCLVFIVLLTEKIFNIESMSSFFKCVLDILTIYVIPHIEPNLNKLLMLVTYLEFAKTKIGAC